ncbi:hypothetical protein GW17_00030104 [Ensete ventricosum]|nr:hypothetical protein GW17_00030104 [Ensete ventricosum]
MQVIKLADEVESIFTKHFAGDDRKRAMKFLRPQKPRESHTITFFVGTYPSFPQISIEVSASSPDAHTYGAFNALRVYLIAMATVKICTHDIRVRSVHGQLCDFVRCVRNLGSFVDAQHCVFATVQSKLAHPFACSCPSFVFRPRKLHGCMYALQVLMVDFFMADQLTSQVST